MVKFKDVPNKIGKDFVVEGGKDGEHYWRVSITSQSKFNRHLWIPHSIAKDGFKFEDAMNDMFEQLVKAENG